MSRIKKFSPYASAVSGLVLLIFGVLMVTDNMHFLNMLIIQLVSYISPA
ncbi:MAG: hypothetical protein ACE5G7_06530 [Candidatus Hydrothermarchaeaceae archaeon]